MRLFLYILSGREVFKVSGFAVEQVYAAALVFLAVCGAVTTIGKAVEMVRNWCKPGASIKHKVDRHEKQLGDLKDGQKVCCKALIALLGHELHNGNADEMQEASKELNDYLVNR